MKTLQAKHQEEVNEFEGLFFAFNNNQLKEGLEKVGLKEGDTDKIVSIGASGYLRKDRKEAFLDMFARQKDESKRAREEQKTIDIEFVGISSWNHAIFKSIDKPYRFYGSTCTLFDDGDTEEKVLSQLDEDSLCYFGSSFGCEPMGTTAGNIKILTKTVK